MTVGKQMLSFINSCNSPSTKPSRKKAIEKLGLLILNIVRIEDKDMDSEAKDLIIKGLAKEWTSNEKDQEKLIQEAKAYILIETSVGSSKTVSDKLRKISSVVRVDAVTGPYDIIAVINAPDLTAVGDLITSQIHVIDGIVRTITCLSMGSTN